jgi:ppGpp synthetase/RelA/SpoT-type nucleotidyltranferase
MKTEVQTFNLSKNQVRKLGDRLRFAANYDEHDLSMLQAYRVSHKEAISNVFSIINNITKYHVPAAINTFRIKRIESILRKLVRMPDMELDRMWDIAGCRIIVKKDVEIAIVIDELAKNFHVRDQKDYLTASQPSGYRAYHLFVSLDETRKEVIEIQIRTVEQHNWATFVEIIDFLFGLNIKEGEKHTEIERFHWLMSRKKELSYREKIEVVTISDNLDFYSTIGKIFISNYLHVRSEYLSIKKSGKHNKFFIIESTKDDVPIIEPFLDFTEAEKEYYNKYLTNKNANIVLISIGHPSFEKLSIAYSNYILMMHSFVDDYFVILHDLIIESVKVGKARDYLKFRKLYIKTANIYTAQVNKEFETWIEKSKSSKKNKELAKWQDEIKKKATQFTDSIVKLNNELRSCYPKKGFNKFKFDLVTRFYHEK